MLKSVLEPIKNIDEDRLFAFLGYCFLLCVVPLIFKRDSELAVFHGRQGLALFLCEMVVFVLSILFPWMIKPFVLVFAALSLWGMVVALKGELLRMPVIYAISQKLNL